MKRLRAGSVLASMAVLAVAAGARAASPEPQPAPAASTLAPGHVTGVGGIFFRSRDPKALAAWYHTMLGVELESWGGAMLRYDAPGHPRVLVWTPFPQTTHYFAPSTREFMIDFAVDDLDAVIARLKAGGVPVLKRDDSSPDGNFAWIVDPDGTKIELWQPKPGRR